MMPPARTGILLVEDDPALGRSLQQALAQEGYQVTWEHTGQRGLLAARRREPQLFILDVRLPDISGFDLCRTLRQEGFRQPILMLTARRDEMDKVLVLEMGADDYLTKPYGLRELLARLRALLRRAYGDLAEESGTRLQVQDLTIDLTRAEVRRGDEVLHLTPTEYRLLVYLAQHAGQALSRRQILAAVWDDTAAVESERTVNVHIRRLREKIELDPGRPALVLTVPGIGYRLVAAW